MAADNGQDVKAEELTAVIREIRQRVRARHPEGSLGVANIAYPDVLRLVHARDATMGKVASIGTVNPRQPGLVNSIVQFVKRVVARALDWHVREQVEFNHGVMQCVQAAIDTLAEVNNALAQMTSHIQQEFAAVRQEFVAVRQEVEAGQRQDITAVRQEIEAVRRQEVEGVRQEVGEVRREIEGVRQEYAPDLAQMRDVRAHWAQWRPDWEERLAKSEVQLLRTVAEMQGAFQHRVSQMEYNLSASVRTSIDAQHSDFKSALERTTIEIQKRMWADMERIRAEYETLIYNELRVLRQRAAAAPKSEVVVAAQTAPATEPVPIDWFRFSDRFRGAEERIRAQQAEYIERFQDASDVLDIGCGRGEFLEAAKAAGIAARGIDLSEEMVAFCRSKGLEVEQADLFRYLDDLADASLGGVYCSQVIEHLPPEMLPRMVRLVSAKLRRGGLLAIETPNPECLAIFATHFFLDPTHTRPVPPALLVFYLEEFGFGNIDVERLFPAVETMPALASLPEDVRGEFFGGLDYAVLARKL